LVKKKEKNHRLDGTRVERKLTIGEKGSRVTGQRGDQRGSTNAGECANPRKALGGGHKSQVQRRAYRGKEYVKKELERADRPNLRKQDRVGRGKGFKPSKKGGRRTKP